MSISSFYPTVKKNGNEKIAAADYGAVSWRVYSQELATFLDSTGFPSSNIKDTNMDLLQAFDSDDNDDIWRYLLFMFGYFDGDGTVNWMVIPNTWPPCIRISQVILIARDKKLLPWIKEKLENIGFANIRVTWQSNAVIHRLYISCHIQHNVELLQMGIDKIQQLGFTLSGNMEFLSALLDNEAIPSTDMPPRIPFHEYLGEMIDDPIGRVIAQ